MSFPTSLYLLQSGSFVEKAISNANDTDLISRGIYIHNSANVANGTAIVNNVKIGNGVFIGRGRTIYRTIFRSHQIRKRV